MNGVPSTKTLIYNIGTKFLFLRVCYVTFRGSCGGVKHGMNVKPEWTPSAHSISLHRTSHGQIATHALSDVRARGGCRAAKTWIERGIQHGSWNGISKRATRKGAVKGFWKEIWKVYCKGKLKRNVQKGIWNVQRKDKSTKNIEKGNLKWTLKGKLKSELQGTLNWGLQVNKTNSYVYCSRLIATTARHIPDRGRRCAYSMAQPHRQGVRLYVRFVHQRFSNFPSCTCIDVSRYFDVKAKEWKLGKKGRGLQK